MNDILSTKGMWSESRDLFKFWEISHDVSLTVQDKDIVASSVFYGPRFLIQTKE